MSSASSGKPQVLPTVIINEEGETPSLLNPTTGQILLTNPVGKRIIELADGSRSVEGIAEEIARQFRGADRSKVLADTGKFLTAAAEKGMLTWNRGP